MQSGMAFPNHSADHCHQFLVKKTHTFHSRTLNTSASVLQRSTCFLCDPVLTLYIHDTANHRSSSHEKHMRKYPASALHFLEQWRFLHVLPLVQVFFAKRFVLMPTCTLHEALCFDVDSHSSASNSAVFFVAFILRALEN